MHRLNLVVLISFVILIFVNVLFCHLFDYLFVFFLNLTEKYIAKFKYGISVGKAPSTLIRFQTKTELFCSGFGYRPHYNAENDHRKRSHSKTLSRVERFENNAF